MRSADIKENWCDAQLQGLWWENSGRDLVLSISPPDQELLRRVKFEWVHGAVIQLNFRSAAGGMPLVWRADFDSRANSEVSVLIDFGSAGQIRFVCSTLADVD